MDIREFINRQPMLGWAVAVVVALIATMMFLRNLGASETSELSQDVTVRCRDTGKEWKMRRGVMEKELMMRPYPVNPDEGIINPDTGKPTGFPVDDWKLTVDRVNSSRAPLAEKQVPKKSAPAKPAGGGK